MHVIRRTLCILPAGVPDFLLGFASDLHIGPTTPPRDLDVLLLGGDCVILEASRRKARALGAFVRRIQAPRTLVVLGNQP